MSRNKLSRSGRRAHIYTALSHCDIGEGSATNDVIAGLSLHAAITGASNLPVAAPRRVSLVGKTVVCTICL